MAEFMSILLEKLDLEHLGLERLANGPIEDPRRHSPEIVEALRGALASGAPAIPEARRPGFFEIYAQDQVFYIHFSRATKRITLLATWSCEAALEPVHSA